MSSNGLPCNRDGVVVHPANISRNSDTNAHQAAMLQCSAVVFAMIENNSGQSAEEPAVNGTDQANASRFPRERSRCLLGMCRPGMRN